MTLPLCPFCGHPPAVKPDSLVQRVNCRNRACGIFGVVMLVKFWIARADAFVAEAEQIRIIAYLSYDTIYSDDFCVRCSHEPSNCECKSPVYMAGWEPNDKLKALKVCLFQES